MIFDISGLSDIGRFEFWIKLTENLVQIFSDNICQNVESATMGHSHYKRAPAHQRKCVDKSLHTRNDHFETFKTKSFLRDPLFGQKLFEFCRSEVLFTLYLNFFNSIPNKAFKCKSLLIRCAHGMGSFEFFSDPLFLFLTSYVHKLNSDRATIGLMKPFFDFAKGQLGFPLFSDMAFV